MAKAATYKDICYALEFGGERLIRTFSEERRKALWTFQKTGNPVDPRDAQKFMQSPNCLPLNDGLFPGSSQSYAWKS